MPQCKMRVLHDDGDLCRGLLSYGSRSVQLRDAEKNLNSDW
jgi:hypothetical protein